MVADDAFGTAATSGSAEAGPPEGPLVAYFADAQGVLTAARELIRNGIGVAEIYGPYPLHEADHLLGRRRSRLPWVTLAAGACGTAMALGLQFYTNVLHWPMNVGGKPANSLLAFIPITFELTVLLGGVATAGAFLAASRLIPRLRPPGLLDGVTDDRFALVVDHLAPGFDEKEAQRILDAVGGGEIRSPKTSEATFEGKV